MEILTFQEHEARCQDRLLDLANAVFGEMDADYLNGRLSQVAGPLLHVAVEDGQWHGFKLAYNRGSTLYSWLGGTHPDARGKGVARSLMNAQHSAARDLGYKAVETRTRTENNPMIILNLRSGFEIVGFETDRHCNPVITQRKVLG